MLELGFQTLQWSRDRFLTAAAYLQGSDLYAKPYRAEPSRVASFDGFALVASGALAERGSARWLQEVDVSGDGRVAVVVGNEDGRPTVLLEGEKLLLVASSHRLELMSEGGHVLWDGAAQRWHKDGEAYSRLMLADERLLARVKELDARKRPHPFTPSRLSPLA